MYYLEKREPYISFDLIGSKIHQNETRKWNKKAECTEIFPIENLYNKIPADEKTNYRIIQEKSL